MGANSKIEYERLKAENARLREALSSMTDAASAIVNQDILCDDDYQKLADCIAPAREALKGGA